MSDGEERVAKQHPRSRIAHDGLDLNSLFRLVAVDGALATGGFGILKGAVIQTMECVFVEGVAIWAELDGLMGVVRYMVLCAVELNHGSDRFLFATHSGVGHGRASFCNM